MNLYFTNLIHSSSQNFDQRRQVLRCFGYKPQQQTKKGELYWSGTYYLPIENLSKDVDQLSVC